MVLKKNAKSKTLLTEVELELMTLLWRLGEGTVTEVQGALPAARKLAYTSVSTMLRILEQKGIVTSRKAGRGHVYLPRLAKAEYEAASLKHLVQNVFDGTPSSLVRRLVEQDDLSAEELGEIRALLEERLKTK